MFFVLVLNIPPIYSNVTILGIYSGEGIRRHELLCCPAASWKPNKQKPGG